VGLILCSDIYPIDGFEALSTSAEVITTRLPLGSIFDKRGRLLEAVLQRLPVLREATLRDGQSNLPNTLLAKRAHFVHLRGTEAAMPCQDCEHGSGFFDKCVILEGKFTGACTNCSYHSGGAFCSFRTPSKDSVGGL
jgi:hypothetical protein